MKDLKLQPIRLHAVNETESEGTTYLTKDITVGEEGQLVSVEFKEIEKSTEAGTEAVVEDGTDEITETDSEKATDEVEEFTGKKFIFRMM